MNGHFSKSANADYVQNVSDGKFEKLSQNQRNLCQYQDAKFWELSATRLECQKAKKLKN